MTKIIAIDIGNTNIVFGLYEGDYLLKTHRIATREASTRLVQDIVAGVPDGIISSVVPNLTDLVLQAAGNGFVVAKFDNIGVKTTLSNPEEIGTDRLINALAATRKYKAPLIVVDFGTATTFDVVDIDGVYIGGAIAPGPNLSLKALSAAAAQLPDIEFKQATNIIGKNTVDAMNSGLYFGYVSLIEGMVAKITQEFGKPLKLIATGGLANLFTEPAMINDQNLTLDGLKMVYMMDLLNKDEELKLC